MFPLPASEEAMAVDALTRLVKAATDDHWSIKVVPPDRPSYPYWTLEFEKAGEAHEVNGTEGETFGSVVKRSTEAWNKYAGTGEFPPWVEPR